MWNLLSGVSRRGVVNVTIFKAVSIEGRRILGNKAWVRGLYVGKVRLSMILSEGERE